MNSLLSLRNKLLRLSLNRKVDYVDALCEITRGDACKGGRVMLLALRDFIVVEATEEQRQRAYDLVSQKRRYKAPHHA